MSDQQPPATEQPTADNPAPGAGTPEAPQIPAGYVPADQYNELRGWSTREAQWRSEHEPTVQLIQAAQNGDPDAARQLLGQLGYDVADDETIDLSGDPGQPQGDPQLLARLEAIEQHHATQQQTQAEQQHYAGYRELINPELDGLTIDGQKVTVPEGIRDAVADFAYHQLPPVPTAPSAKYPNGLKPDLEGAFDAITQFLVSGAEVPAVQTAVKKAWQSTKPSSAVTQPGGLPATHTPELNTRQARADHISQLLAQADND